MRAATALRVVAITIATVGAIDPMVTTSRPPPLDVDVAVPAESTATTAEHAAAEPAAAARSRVVRELTAAVGDAVRLRVRSSHAGDRLPCAADVPCVVLTDVTVPPRGGFERTRPLLVLPPAADVLPAGVTIDDAQAVLAHLDTQATVAVTLSASGAAGRETRLDIRDGDVPVGAARHAWTDHTRATVAVPWWPAQSGRRRLTVVASTRSADGLPVQEQHMAVDADVTATPWPVLVIESRPSWAATFVRRALEADARFVIDAHVGLAPGLTTGVVRTAVTDARVEPARVVVVGGLDGLNDADERRLDRVLAERGGAVVLVPDAPMTGPVTRLLPGRWRHRLDAAPTDVVDLRASEWLLASGLDPSDLVLASHAGAPAIVSRQVGEGRLVVVGALDAWRFRASVAAVAAEAAGPSSASVTDPGRADADRATPFTRFWQTLVADLALGSGPPVEVGLSHEPGDDHATVDVQARVFDTRSEWQVAARLVCEGKEAPLRLWPQSRVGHFRGVVSWPGDGRACEIVAALHGVGEGRAWLSAPSMTPAEGRRVVERLRAVAASSGGVAAAPGDVGAVARALAARPRATPVNAPRWPMRSWWWGLTVALALGGEWWLRRHSGAR